MFQILYKKISSVLNKIMLKILWLCFFCGHNVLAAAAVNTICMASGVINRPTVSTGNNRHKGFLVSKFSFLV